MIGRSLRSFGSPRADRTFAMMGYPPHFVSFNLASPNWNATRSPSSRKYSNASCSWADFGIAYLFFMVRSAFASKRYGFPPLVRHALFSRRHAGTSRQNSSTRNGPST